VGFAQSKPNHYAVYLADPPVISRYSREALTTESAAAYRQQLEARQAVVTRALESRQIHVTGTVSTLINAIFIATTEDRVAEVESLPGVTGVRRLPPPGKRSLNKATVAGGAPAAWTALGGQSKAGAGIKIGIMDTGIDQNNPAFQDSSLTVPSGFPKCTQGHPEDCTNFTNNKVIVARSYVRQIAAGYEVDPVNNPAAQSMPDDYSPRDRDGHGTGVAAAAAGNQNSAPAVPFSGMAPKAFLGNYKVYGTSGVNDYPTADVWIQAVDDAVADGMDVINFSSGVPALTGALNQGADCGLPAATATQTNWCDPLAAAFEAAAKAGVVMAVSAGNDGADTSGTTGVYPTFNSITSPAIAPSVIAVGGTMNSHVMTPSVSVTAASAPASLKNLVATDSDAFFPVSGAAGAVFPAAVAPLVDVTQVGDTGYACNTLPAGSLNNVFALIQRGNVSGSTACTFDVKTTNAQNAGAIGVILYNNVSTAPPMIEGADNFAGPVVMITQSAGAALKAYIDANSGALVTIDTSGTETDVLTFINTVNAAYQSGITGAPNQLLSFSSVGPTPDGKLKPDMLAVGGSDSFGIDSNNDPYLPFPAGMYTAAQSFDPNGELYSANGYISANGTSFASPLVAGAAALMKQAHPGLRSTQIKSLLVNSAAQDVTTDDYGDPVDAESIGAGRLNAGAAIALTVTAEPATVSFGVVKSGALPMTQTITLTNLGTAAVTLAPTVSCCSVNATVSTVSGTTVAATPASITLAAGGTASLTVTLSGTVPAAGAYSGTIALKGTGVTMQMPFLFLVGSGTAYNANLLTALPYLPFDSGTGNSEGLPSQDAGPVAIQVTDQFGVPVANSPMTVKATPTGSVTLKSVAGEPACSPASSTTQVTCTTDAFGVAYAEVVLGANLRTPTITAAAANTTILDTGIEIVAAPSLTAAGIVNDGSFQQPVAPGSWVAMFGSSLVNTNEVFDTTNGDNSGSYIGQSNMLPLALDGTTVSFDVPSAGISVPGYLYYVSPDGSQIDVWVPWELENQSSVQVKVTLDEGLYGNVVTLPLSNFAPAFFLNSGNVADALDGNYNIITAANPAVRGQYIALYVNGLGPTNNQPASGLVAPGNPNLATTKTTPVVTIGGQPATVVFSGLAPGIVGEYQVNVQVPAGISAGNQPITIAIGGVTSPAKTAGSSPQTIMIPVK